MNGTMKCIVKTAAGPGNLELQTRPIPSPGPGEVLAKVHLAAICGTDIHIKNWAEFAQKRMNPPSIIGHEFCGDIVEAGEGVDPSRIGQLISAETHIACHKCALCMDGKAHLCVNTLGLGVHINGCFAEYVVLPSENAMVCSPDVSEQNNAILEPLGTVVQAATKVAAAGKTVAVTGCGPMGSPLSQLIEFSCGLSGVAAAVIPDGMDIYLAGTLHQGSILLKGGVLVFIYHGGAYYTRQSLCVQIQT